MVRPGKSGVRNWGELIAKRICHWRPINLRAVRKTLSIGCLIASRSWGLDVRSHAPAIVDLRPLNSALVIVSFLGVYIVRVQGSRNGLTLFQVAIATALSKVSAPAMYRTVSPVEEFRTDSGCLRSCFHARDTPIVCWKHGRGRSLSRRHVDPRFLAISFQLSFQRFVVCREICLDKTMLFDSTRVLNLMMVFVESILRWKLGE